LPVNGNNKATPERQRKILSIADQGKLDKSFFIFYLIIFYRTKKHISLILMILRKSIYQKKQAVLKTQIYEQPT
jgi:hypothetical protein